MEAVAHRQEKFVKNFLDNSTRLLEFGFAYLFAHPEWIPLMDEEIEKIRSLEKLQTRSAFDECQHRRCLRQAYIDYIVMITKLGFKYVKAHPETFNEVCDLKKIFEEYEQLRKDFQIAKILNKPRVNGKCKGKKDEPQVNPMKEFKQLRGHLTNVQDQLKRNHQSPRERQSSRDILKKFNQNLTDKVNEIREEKRIIRLQHERQQAKPVIRERNSPKQFQKKTFIRDSDNDSSECLISLEQFEKPSNEKPRVGPIERHLLIPVHANKSPKITPRIHFQKSPINGSMQLDLKLNFEDGILYQNKLVKGICIKNVFPVQNFSSK